MKKKAMLSQPMAGKTDEEIVAVREKAIADLEATGYEVADRMRRYDVSGFKESAIAPFLECLGHGYTDWRGVLDELADLIDRPTCHIYETDHEFEDSVRCDRCQTTFMRPWEPFKYCPECGARVVSADDAS